MTDTSKTRKAEQPVEILELNRETIQDLTEQEGDQARGGRVPHTESCQRDCHCTEDFSGCRPQS